MNKTYQEKVIGVVKALDTVALVYGLSLKDSGKALVIEVNLDNVGTGKGEIR